MSNTHQPGRLNGDSPVLNAACAPELVQGKVGVIVDLDEGRFLRVCCLECREVGGTLSFAHENYGVAVECDSCSALLTPAFNQFTGVIQ